MYNATLEEYNALNPVCVVTAPVYPLLSDNNGSASQQQRGTDQSSSSSVQRASGSEGGGAGSTGALAVNSSRRATVGPSSATEAFAAQARAATAVLPPSKPNGECYTNPFSATVQYSTVQYSRTKQCINQK